MLRLLVQLAQILLEKNLWRRKKQHPLPETNSSPLKVDPSPPKKKTNGEVVPLLKRHPKTFSG